MPERFFVTGSGMQSIQIALQIALDPGDAIIVPSPAWPNIVAAAGLRQAMVLEVAMPFVDGRFTLDMNGHRRGRQKSPKRARSSSIHPPTRLAGLPIWQR
jgi:aspartate/methionine/tyrosine aminotransferase